MTDRRPLAATDLEVDPAGLPLAAQSLVGANILPAHGEKAAGADPQEVVAAAPGKIIRAVLAYTGPAAGATGTWYSGNAGIISPVFDEPVVMSGANVFETKRGEALQLKATGGAVKYHVRYVLAEV